jgi:hypothetical protein
MNEDVKVLLAEIGKDLEYMIKYSDDLKADLHKAQEDLIKRAEEIKDAFFIAERASQKLDEHIDAFRDYKEEINTKLEAAGVSLEELKGNQLKDKKLVLLLQAFLALLGGLGIMFGILHQLEVFQ